MAAAVWFQHCRLRSSNRAVIALVIVLGACAALNLTGYLLREQLLWFAISRDIQRRVEVFLYDPPAQLTIEIRNYITVTYCIWNLITYRDMMFAPDDQRGNPRFEQRLDIWMQVEAKGQAEIAEEYKPVPRWARRRAEWWMRVLPSGNVGFEHWYGWPVRVLGVAEIKLPAHSSYTPRRDLPGAIVADSMSRRIGIRSGSVLVKSEDHLYIIPLRAVLRMLGVLSLIWIGVVAVFVSAQSIVSLRRIAAGRCHLCGYCLDGVRADRCPECATPRIHSLAGGMPTP